MHSQEILAQVRNNLFVDPQKCIKILSHKAFLNNLFHQHLQQLVQIIQAPLNKINKENKSLSFACPQTVSRDSNTKKSEELNAQLIVCIYCIIIMKSTSKSIIASEQTPIFNSKLAIETLTKIHKQIKLEDIRKIVSALLLKIPSFTNHKTIIRDVSPEFVSTKTMEKASSIFRSQCPNLFEQKIIAHKNTQWGKFLSYKPFKLDSYGETFKKLLTTGTSSTDANALIEIRQELKKESQFLQKRIEIISKEEFFIFEFCEKFSELYKMRLQFSKLLEGQRFAESKNSANPKNLPSYNINQLRLKILLEGKNHLLVILIQLIKKLSTYWTRKLKWLFDFITERVEIYGLEEMGLSSIQQADIYMQKITELKLLIKLAHTYYKQFGEGLFPEQKLKAILFTQEYSFYKMIEALLYNEYEFAYSSESSRIVNYQKTKKISQQSKNKKSLIKTINVNSKSLNINPHYDLVFQKAIEQITYKHGNSYFWIRELIQEALKFMCSFYKNAQTYFYGGNLITMIQNCKNAEIPKQKIILFLKEIKSILYPTKRMIKQGLQFFCEEVFHGYISKKKYIQENEQKNSSTFNICQTPFITIHSKINSSVVNNQLSSHNGMINIAQSSSTSNEKGVIRKTKSYDMVVEGWSQVNQPQNDNSLKERVPELSGKQSQIFYSIREGGSNEEKNGANLIQKEIQKFESMKDNGEDEEFILTPEF